MSGALEAALRRDRAITLAALTLLALIAWAWLLLGAGMGMGSHFALDPIPHLRPEDGMAMGPPGWSATHFLLVFSMWWVMMVAMMLPAAAPVVLLYARAVPRGDEGATPPTGHFLAGYLLVWGLFSLAATAAQGMLETSGLLSGMTMGSSGKWLSVAILLAAGLYQLSPLKESCLAHCRNPATFLSRNYRAGRLGALKMGARHGAFCVGCCWLLMALLFVGGVMNLAWIALLTLLVAGEKMLPAGRKVALAAGALFIGWSALTALA